MLDGPIPGMSLTAEYGGRPWQQPPKNTTIEEALSFYMPRLSDETFVPELLKVMELGIPLTTIANAMQTGAVMQGQHSVDVGILIIPVLIEVMALIGDREGVEYTVGTEDNTVPVNPDLDMALIAKELNQEATNAMDIGNIGMEEDVQDEEPVAETTGGLMSRRI
jgi:hypothetical protein|tara:strand:- start:200 stop:694 length:495 start_codon:yes stop_codon:yes gene_type:complete